MLIVLSSKGSCQNLIPLSYLVNGILNEFHQFLMSYVQGSDFFRKEVFLKLTQKRNEGSFEIETTFHFEKDGDAVLELPSKENLLRAVGEFGGNGQTDLGSFIHSLSYLKEEIIDFLFEQLIESSNIETNL